MFDYENNCDIHGYPGYPGCTKMYYNPGSQHALRVLISKYLPRLRCWVNGQPIDERTFREIFGWEDVDITNRKHKKSYIMQEFNRVEYFMDSMMPFVYNHIRSSTLLQNMAIKIAEYDYDGDNLMFLPIPDTSLIKLLKIGGNYDRITEIMYNYMPRCKMTRVKFIKAYIKSKQTWEYVHLGSNLSFYFNRVNMYILYALGKTCQRYICSLKNKFLLFHIMILHRRNKIKFNNIPYRATYLYNTASLISNAFAGKNLSRLSLYYV